MIVRIFAFIVVIVLIFCYSYLAPNLSGFEKTKSILIIYNVGTPPWQRSQPLEIKNVDALTQATTQEINTEIIARAMKDQLSKNGFQVTLKKATEIHEPTEYLDYDCLIFGSPNWFSNMAYPIKQLFDEHFIRIWDHHQGKLNEKVLAGFVAAMEVDTNGKQCLQGIYGVLEQMSQRTVEGIVVNVYSGKATMEKSVEQFCLRIIEKVKSE